MGEADSRREVAARLRTSKKYRYLCEDTLLRIADWALTRHPSPREAVKAARRKLHQAVGAYFERTHFGHLETLLEALAPPVPDLREICREILTCHASTAERTGILPGLYPALFEEIGHPESILDLGCGLHPFSLPWMGLGPEVRYEAWDIDARLVDAVNRFFGLLGIEPGAVCRDILVSAPDTGADVVFLLKSLPCLEQQEKGCARALLNRLRGRPVVVSFPLRSLGGKQKGMAQHYASVMATLAGALDAPVRELPYPEEIFYILEL